jgi:ABC-type transport system substrate-binding protein
VDDVARDPTVRDLLVVGGTTVEPENRRAAYKKALTRIAEQAYTVPLYSLPVTTRRRRTSPSRPIRTRCRASGK